MMMKSITIGAIMLVAILSMIYFTGIGNYILHMKHPKSVKYLIKSLIILSWVAMMLLFATLLETMMQYIIKN